VRRLGSLFVRRQTIMATPTCVFMRRCLIIAVALVIIVGSVIASAGPVFAAVGVSASPPTGFGHLNHATCRKEATITVRAMFSEPVRHDEVALTVGGLGLFDSHEPGGVTQDHFTFTVTGLAPGSYEITARWLAHNGNGLSAGRATAMGSLEIEEQPPTQRLSDEAKCTLEKATRSFFWLGIILGGAGLVLAPFCPPCAVVVEVVAIFAELAAVYAWSAADDPVDPNYTVLANPDPPRVPLIQPGQGVNANAASAINALLQEMANLIGQSRATLTSLNRAQGAWIAHDRTWEERQMRAAAGFAEAQASALDRLPGLLTTGRAALAASSFPDQAVTPAMVDKYQFQTAAQGLSSGHMQQLRDLGATDADIAKISTRITDPDLPPVPATLLGTFVDPQLHAELGSAAMRLREFAAVIRADPFRQYAPTGTGGTSNPADTLLTDGGFEPATGIPSVDFFQTFPAGPLGAWNITSGGVDLVGTHSARAAEGEQFIDLNGNAQGSASISQTIPTTPGHTYLVRYSVAGNPNGPPAVKTGVVSFAGTTYPFQFDSTGHTNDDLGWRVDQFQSTPCTDHATLTLTSTTEGDQGPNIDWVTVTDTGAAAVPCTPACPLPAPCPPTPTCASPTPAPASQ